MSGLSVFFRKLSVDKINPYQVQIVSTIIYTSLIPLWMYLCQKQNVPEMNASGVYFAVICTITGIVSSICLGFALHQSNSPGVISSLVSLSPMITMSLSILFMHETLSLTKIIAFILALISAILVNF